MTGVQWNLHNFPAALAKWILRERPPTPLVVLVSHWAQAIRADGPQDHWTLVDNDRYFIVRIPSTDTYVFGEVQYYERLLIFTKIDGT